MRPSGLAAALLLPLLVCPAAAAGCLRADGTEQVVEGKLVVGRFRNYTGKLAPAYILELRLPACLTGTDDFDTVERSLRVHVYSLDAAMLHRLKAQVGRQVTVRGRAFGQVSYHHHHAPIVMEASAVVRR